MFFQEKINVLWINFGFKYTVKRRSNILSVKNVKYYLARSVLRSVLRGIWKGSLKTRARIECSDQTITEGTDRRTDGFCHTLSQKPIFPPLTWSVRGLARKCSHSCSMIPEVTRPASETEQESSGLSTMARISAASGVGGRVVSSITGGILKNNRSCGKLIWNLIKG